MNTQSFIGSQCTLGIPCPPYATTRPLDEVATLTARVDEHLKQIGAVWT
jgi:hypothetical protein